jgi:hypothetical protein
MTWLIGLGLLIVAGGFIYKRQKAKKTTYPSFVDAEVARSLARQEPFVDEPYEPEFVKPKRKPVARKPTKRKKNTKYVGALRKH